MPVFRVNFYYERVKSFYVAADDQYAVHDFLEKHPDWEPEDVEGLVAHDGEDQDAENVGVEVRAEPVVTANHALVNGALVEVG